jgi:hypothetical protein
MMFFSPCTGGLRLLRRPGDGDASKEVATIMTAGLTDRVDARRTHVGEKQIVSVPPTPREMVSRTGLWVQ